MPVVRLLVTGRVQGVGYRWFVRESARRLELAGWVRNRPDGAVEVMASGPAERLEPFLQAVHQGPDGAVVRGVESLAAPVGEMVDRPFAILR